MDILIIILLLLLFVGVFFFSPSLPLVCLVPVFSGLRINNSNDLVSQLCRFKYSAKSYLI